MRKANPVPLRAAIVGTGSISRIHGRRIQDLGSELVAVCGRQLSNAQELVADLGVAAKTENSTWTSGIRAYDDLHTMLDEVHPDVLHVCTPHGLHAQQVRVALDREINVICEKPLATNIADAQMLLDASQKAGVHAALCLVQRSYPMVTELRALIRRNEIGQLQAIRGTFLSWDANHNNWGWSFDPAIAGNSYATADLGIHWLDLVEYVTGSRIREVEARFSTIRPVRLKNGTEVTVESEDYVRLFFELADGTPGSAVFSGVCAGEPNGCVIEVDGMDGGLHWRADQPNKLQQRRSDGAVVTLIRDPGRLSPEAGRLAFNPAGHVEGFGDAFRNLIGDVYAAIGGEERKYPTFEDGLRLAVIVQAIQQSALIRKAVTID